MRSSLLQVHFDADSCWSRLSPLAPVPWNLFVGDPSGVGRGQDLRTSHILAHHSLLLMNTGSSPLKNPRYCPRRVRWPCPIPAAIAFSSIPLVREVPYAIL